MDLKLGPDGVRYRLSLEEARALAGGAEIAHRLGPVGWSVRTGTRAEPQFDAPALALTLPKPALESLLDRGRDKAGIELTVEGIPISVAIDIRDPALRRRQA
jgi:hypothetical protein